MVKFSSDVVRALFGPRFTWSVKNDARRQSADMAARLSDLFARVPKSEWAASDSPVFIFSAGWRSGSTLLQRMIMQRNSGIIIWGEPFHLSNIFDNMANQFRSFTDRQPREEYFLSNRMSGGLSDQWVANLYPDVKDLLEAHRRFFQVLFSDPAAKVGAERWGAKVVRLSIDHAMYLRRIYPKAKIIFTCRDPLESYASFRDVNDALFLKWPEKVVATPYAFGRHWAELTRGFMERGAEVGSFFIRYEDLGRTEEVRRLEEYLGWSIPCSSEMQRIAGEKVLGGQAGGRTGNLPGIDRILLRMAIGNVRKDAGY